MLRPRHERWDALSREILRQCFEPAEDELWNYDAPNDISSLIAAMQRGPDAERTWLIDLLTMQVSVLSSLRERLPLLPDPDGRRGRSIAPEADKRSLRRCSPADDTQAISRTPPEELFFGADAETFWALATRKREDESWDYKETLDTGRGDAFARLAKDIIAFANRGGGALLFGIADDHRIVGCGAPVDQARLHTTLEQRLGVDVKFAAYFFETERDGCTMMLGIIVVQPSDHIVVVERTLHDSSQKPLLNAGQVYMRRGERTIIATGRDLDRIRARLATAPGAVVTAAPERAPLRADVAKVVERFVELFAAHGVARVQIHRLIDPRFRLRLEHFASDAALLGCLNDALLAWTAAFFGIRPAWLDGLDDRIYDTPDVYLHAGQFADLIGTLGTPGLQPEVYAFKTVPALDRSVSSDAQYVAFVVAVEIARLGDQEVHRYVPISTDWTWGYEKARLECKAVLYLCERLNLHVYGYDMRCDELDHIRWGEEIPHFRIIRGAPVTWHPSDYIFKGSPVAKEADEMPSLLNYVARRGYRPR